MNRLLAVFAVLLCCATAQAQHCGTGFAFKTYGHSFNTFGHYGTTYNHKAIVAAPIVVVPDIAYTPTTALQLAAVKTNYIRTDADYNAFLQFKAFEAGLAAANAQRLPYAAPVQPQQQPQYAQQQYGQQPAQQPLTGQPGAAGAVVAPPTVSNPPPAPGQSVVAPQPGQPRVLGIVQHCGKCHGAQLETPRGNPPIYIDPTKQLSGDDILRAVRVMRLPETDPYVMPPPPAKLTAEEKGGIFEELLSLQIGGPTR